MADYIVTDTELTSIADAIRAKGGTSAELEFPSEFVSAIGDIETGNIDFINAMTQYCATGYFGNKLVIPEGVEVIGNSVFSGDKIWNLDTLYLPSSIISIGAEAFAYNDVYPTTVVFRGTPSSIANNAFEECASLYDIYVPWSQGEVAGAPWGSYATVHYDSDTSNM